MWFIFSALQFPFSFCCFFHVVFELFYLIQVLKNLFYSKDHSWAIFFSSGYIFFNSTFFIFFHAMFLSLFLLLSNFLCYIYTLSCWYCWGIPSWYLSNRISPKSGHIMQTSPVRVLRPLINGCHLFLFYT